MPVSVSCSTCDKSYKVSSKLAGKRVKCPGCQGPIKVPLGAAKQPAPVAAPADGDYDLAALAAAENAAEVIEPRVYEPKAFVEAPEEDRPQRQSEWVKVTPKSRKSFGGGGSGRAGSFSGAFLLLNAPAIILLVVAFVAWSPMVQLLTGAYLIVVLLCAAIATYVFSLMGIFAERSSVITVLGVIACIFVPFCFWIAIIYTLVTEPSRLAQAGKAIVTLLLFLVYTAGYVTIEQQHRPPAASQPPAQNIQFR